MLIVDDHPFFAACLRSLLDAEADLVVCEVAPNSHGLSERIARLQPDLVVIDLSLGAESGLDSGVRLRQLNISIPILFVSSFGRPSPQQLAGIARSAFIPKSERPSAFLAALRHVLAPATTHSEAAAHAVAAPAGAKADGQACSS